MLGGCSKVKQVTAIVLKWYISYINRGNLGNIPEEGGIFQMGPMNLDVTMKFIQVWVFENI